MCVRACVHAHTTCGRGCVRLAEEAPRATVARTCALLPGSGWSRGTSYVYSRIGCTEPFTVTRSSRRHSRCTCHPAVHASGRDRARAGAGLFVCLCVRGCVHALRVRRGGRCGTFGDSIVKNASLIRIRTPYCLRPLCACVCKRVCVCARACICVLVSERRMAVDECRLNAHTRVHTRAHTHARGRTGGCAWTRPRAVPPCSHSARDTWRQL